MSRRSLACIAAVLVLALCVGWFALRARFVGTSTASIASVDRGMSSASTQVDLVEPSASGKGAESSSATRVGAEPIDASESSIDDSTELLWVGGRVELPAGTPADEQAYLLVHTTRNPPQRVELDAGGRFRFALDLDRSFAKLEARGRYVYSTKSLSIDASGQPKDLVLRPTLGFLLRVRLIPSAMALARGVDLALAKITTQPRRVQGRRIGVFADADGFAELGGLDSGIQWIVRVELDGYAVTRSEGHEAKPGGVHELELPISLSPVVSGVVRDERGAPIEDALVKLAIGDEDSPRRSLGANTQSDGRFRRELDDVGPLMVIVDHPGHLLRTLGPWELVEGAQIADLEIVLDAGLAITGVLRLPDGTPVEGVQVFATSLSESSGSPPRRLSTKSRRDGTFRLSGLEDHDYAVFAQDTLPLDPHSKSKVGRLRWTAAVDRLTAGAQGVVLILDHGSTVQGRVVDDLGASIAKVNVTVRSREGHGVQTLSRQLDGSDRFRIEAVPRGSWWLDATASPGTATTSIAIELPADSGREFELVLARPATIEGRVLDPHGIPVGGAYVHCGRIDVEESGRRPEVSELTDDKGRFRFSKITATKHRLVASTSDGMLYTEVELQLAPGETRSGFDVRLK